MFRNQAEQNGRSIVDAPTPASPGESVGSQFVTEADWIPSFWNYLLDLEHEDLVAELVQNDLDQGATRTIISFGKDQLVCEGNGEPVEATGWQRLRKIQGAGDSVPAKRGKIGVKNHGLKTAFTIGDELKLMSAGHSIVQTLYANGRNKPPYPGASPEPVTDLQAPADGCRIIVWYRTAPIEPPQGEANVLRAVHQQEIDEMFLSACASTPEQFAGIVSPDVVTRYEIILQHWRLGEARFLFSCTRPRKIARRIEIFRRRCTVRGTVSPLPEDLQEQAARRRVRLTGRLGQRVADFFRRGRYFFAEVSWPIDRRGKPGTGIGRFRYPIGYPPDSHDAQTGHGAYFNAPFASDNKRHAPARNEATNTELRAACESLLIDAVAHHTVPRWGPASLNPLVPPSTADNHINAVRPLLAKLATRGTIPLLSWRDAAELLVKGKNQKLKEAVRQITVRRNSAERKRYRFVIPAATWAPETIQPALSVLCPRSEMQLDPRTHPDIIRLLTDEETTGFIEDFITFDEEDVFSRIAGEGNQFFGAIRDAEYEFSMPFTARSYLDLIQAALDEKKWNGGKTASLIGTLLLPDSRAQATSFQDLYSSAPLPSDIPGLHLPPVLHSDLVTHPLLRRQRWHRPRYTMARFLEGGALRNADEHTRRQFWKWLSQNERRVSSRERSALADLVIWPDENGHLYRVSDLCEPRSRRVGAVLADSIRRPHEQVRRSGLVSTGGKARTSIRRTPTRDEIAHWINSRIARFTVGEWPDTGAIRHLRRFEVDLAVLLKEPTLARLLGMTGVTLPALARDESIQPRTALVIPNANNDRLALPDRFVLKDRQRALGLDKLSPALSTPTAAMLLDTFYEDPENLAVLQARLQQFLNVTQPDDGERLQLAEMAILPVHGQLRAPSELAFTGNRGDYWGTWKTQFSTQSLSQDDQRRYLDAGVTSAFPDSGTSRAFFEWLSAQAESVLQQHIPSVLRHILHRRGPIHWAEVYTDTPFIPTRGKDGLCLVSLRTARHGPIYLPDAGKVGNSVINRDRAVRLVVAHVKEVTRPISESIRALGIRSLREALMEPERVTATGDVNHVGEKVHARLLTLRSSQFRRTFRKRLNELEVDSELLRNDWWDRLGNIKEMRIAGKLEAGYRFRGRLYFDEVDAGFDPASGIFWMKQDKSIRSSGWYESIAAQLVFKPEARPIDLLALERAVALEISDPSFGRPSGVDLNPSDEDVTEGVTDPDVHDGEGQAGTDADLGEAVVGHSPFKPDPARNTPKPGPISVESTGTLRPHDRRNGAPDSNEDANKSRPAPALERAHIEDLKKDHYASHCQMCLCERPPEELAPLGSYVQWAEVRRRVVEAHHVDPKSGGGARHAGNLILLCKLHHDNFGRRLTRTAVTDALRNNPEEHTINFDNDSKVKGRRIELVLSDTKDTAKLFFTAHHATYWLSQDSSPG